MDGNTCECFNGISKRRINKTMLLLKFFKKKLFSTNLKTVFGSETSFRNYPLNRFDIDMTVIVIFISNFTNTCTISIIAME